jgi:hypothetical protein
MLLVHYPHTVAKAVALEPNSTVRRGNSRL